jgi:uncharacterized DUF497 family protein
MRKRFEWNASKAHANSRKHGVTFEEGASVFDNPLAVIFDDEAHSEGESREIILGHSMHGRLLLVCFVEQQESIRLISARPATTREQKTYEESIFH